MQTFASVLVVIYFISLLISCEMKMRGRLRSTRLTPWPTVVLIMPWLVMFVFAREVVKAIIFLIQTVVSRLKAMRPPKSTLTGEHEAL